MANGRLGSTTVQPFSAALVYSNTSANAAAVNVQATSLSTTTNAKFSYAIDSATVAINQTTTAVAISAGDVDWRIWWLDPVGKTTPVKYLFTSKTTADGNFANNYWNGSAWTTSGSAGSYGNFQGIKLDPYFFTNYSEYNNKTSPTFYVPLSYANNDNALVYSYNLNSGVTGAQLGKILVSDSTNGATSITSATGTYMGGGQDSDLYTDFTVGCASSSPYMGVIAPTVAGSAYTSTSGNLMYQFIGGTSLSSYSQYWFAQRFIASNGFYVCQPSGIGSSYFAICDQESATATGSPNQSFYWGPAASGAKWSGFYSSGSGYDISWFEWNPNTQRFYMEYVGGGAHKIYSASKAQLRALQNGTASYVYITSLTLEASSTPWTGSFYIQRPRRIGASLWQAISNNNNAYISTDLVNWTLATTYWASQGLPATTTTFNGLSSSSYLYLGASVANVNQFSSGFSNVSQNALVENNTTFGNYQRSGLVLSSGDKLYCQNYGSAAYSIYVMGYEG